MLSNALACLFGVAHLTSLGGDYNCMCHCDTGTVTTFLLSHADAMKSKFRNPRMVQSQTPQLKNTNIKILGSAKGRMTVDKV